MKSFDFVKENLRDLFPFDSYRPYQEEVLIKCHKAITEGKAVIIRAPPGFGKSPVAIAISLSFPDTYYVTPQKVLQKQLEKDFHKYLVLIMGRPNFICKIRQEYDCSKGKCQINKGYKCEHESACQEIIETGMRSIDPCEYILQRELGLRSQIALMNFAYFYLIKNYFGARETIIIDEAHNIPEIMVNYVSLTILETHVEFIPRYDKFEEYLEWLKGSALVSINTELGKIEQLLSSTPDDSKEIEDLLKEKHELKNLIWRINNLLEDYKKYNEEWIFEIAGEDISRIKFQPLTVDRFLPNLLWRFSNNIVLMSGSIPDAQMFMREVGLAEKPVELIDVPSTFPVQNRPIYFYPVAKMTKEEKLENLPKIAKACCQIIRKHGSQKGIIHCHTYQNAKLLYYSLDEDLRQRAILQKNGENREITLEKWFRSKDMFFLSVDMTEGLDLKDDLCRYQITIKVPFPYMGDKRVKKRVDKGDWKWYNLEAIKALIQTYGRAIRSETDYATYYIIDSSFRVLYRRNEELFPPYFREAYKLIHNI